MPLGKYAFWQLYFSLEYVHENVVVNHVCLLLLSLCVYGFCAESMFSGVVLDVLSNLATILLRKSERAGCFT